jgi:hypothetical protein
VNAWQHPLERCRACGQDILLQPEITQDLRMVYVRQCSGCGPSGADSGEPDIEGERGRHPMGGSYGGTVGYEGTVGGDPWADTANDDMDARWAAFAVRAEHDDEPLTGQSSEGTFTFAMQARGRRRFRLPLIQRLRQPA